MRKLIVIIICLSLFMGSLSHIVQAESNTDFDIENGVLVKYIGNTSYNIVIPDGVTAIGDNAFDGFQSLTSIDVPDSVISIGNYAFRGCYGLTSFVVPDSVTNIGEGAFSFCEHITTITLPKGITSINPWTFNECLSLKSVTIPDSVTDIKQCAFNGCQGLESVTMPSHVTSIGDRAFNYCGKLASISIPDTVKYIGDNAFTYDPITSINIPFGITEIRDGTFFGTKLKAVDIPVGVTSIGSRAFEECTQLESVVIPATVKTIYQNAFYRCFALQIAIIPGSVEDIQPDAFSLDSNLTIYAFDGSSAFNYALDNGITLMVIDPVFNDIQNHWAVYSILDMYSAGVVSGYGDNTFLPDNNITRAETAVLISKTFGLSINANIDLNFSDKNDIPDWAQPYVAAVEQNNIIKGYDDNTFRASAEITRDELAVMLVRALGYADLEPVKTVFADDSEIPDWAKGYVQKAYDLNLLVGYTENGLRYFKPSNNATRAECCTLLDRIMQTQSDKN